MVGLAFLFKFRMFSIFLKWPNYNQDLVFSVILPLGPTIYPLSLPQCCKKTFCVQYPDFQQKMSKICIFLILPQYDAWHWTKACFLLEMCQKSTVFFSLFMSNMLILAAIIWKCLDFLPEISSILRWQDASFLNPRRCWS